MDRLMGMVRGVIWAGVIWVAALSGAEAADRRVKIINNTGFEIVEFYASNQSRNTWEEDILNAKTLPDGQSIVIDFDDGSGACLFDFRAVFDDGDDLVTNGVNVCDIPDFTYN